MRREILDDRVLGAVRFVDGVTRQGVTRALRVTAPGVRWLRNRRGLWVVARAPGLGAHTTAFRKPPARPALGSVTVTLTVRDPAGSYLARRAVLRLPRDPTPDAGASLFEPFEVPLYPAPAAAVFPSWALVRASVAAASGGAPIAGALLRVVLASATEPAGRGLSDGRGEALVAVPGIPVTTWSNDDGGGRGRRRPDESPVMVSEVPASVEAVADPAADAPPDPDDLETRRASLPSTTSSLALAPGRTLAVELAVELG